MYLVIGSNGSRRSAQMHNFYIVDEVCVPILEVQEKPEVTTSTGHKVPTRNPKAKPWISPYGGKRK
jgi:hypothetical protein